MAFSPIDIPVTEILQSDFITDIALISNSNDLLLKDKIEDLINNLEIDINTLSIGTDNPINYVKADTIIMQDTGFVFQAGAPLQVIASLTKNVDEESVLTVDRLNVNSAISVDTVEATGLTVLDSLDITGSGSFAGSVSFGASVSQSKENVVTTLTNNSGVAEATITVTDTSRQNIFLTLEADSTVFLGGGLVAGLTDITIKVDFDASNPPAQNTEFTIYLVDIREQGTTNSILTDINTYPLNLNITGGLNQSTLGTILLHSDFDTQLKKLGVLAPNLIGYDSTATFVYIKDESSLDRLMIKSYVQMEIFS